VATTGLPSFFADGDDAPVGLDQLIDAAHQPFVHQMHEHRNRLDFQHIIKLCDLFRFLQRLVHHRLIQFALLAARGNDQPFPQFLQLALRNARDAVEIFRVRQ